nr:testis-expressed protein 36 isoform X2 [Paramormyrops kingsleyae]
MIKGGKRYSGMENAGKWKTGDISYLFSIHDNRDALRYSIETYDNVLGRKKFLDERRQHNSHFTFGDRELDYPCKPSIGLATYSSDCRGNQETETANRRRFPRNHLERSNAMSAQTGGNLMWFGRHDSKERIPLSLLGATNKQSLGH